MPATAPRDRIDQTIVGMGCAIGAFFMFAVMQTFAKLLSEHHHVAEIAFYRNAIGLLPFLYMIYIKGRRDIIVIKTSPKSIVTRSTLGALSLIVTFAAFAALPMADATAFLFTSSLIIPALGFFFLKELVGPYRWSAIIVGFIGVLIMLQPTGEGNLTGVMLALSAAMLHAILQIMLRALGKTESPETVTFYFIFIGMFVCLIPMPLIFAVPRWEEIPLILGVGISGVIAQMLISTAYKHAQASIVTVFNYSGIIWATLFGWMFWNEWPDEAILAGGFIVIASNVFIIYREQKLAKIARATVQKTNGL
jgi:drug/metabolite transporter (DMT)-like permease